MDRWILLVNSRVNLKVQKGPLCCNRRQNLRVIIFYEASAAPGSSGRRRWRSLLAGGMDHCFIECQETGRRCTQPATAAANLGSAAGGGQGQGKVWKLIELVVSWV